MSDTVLDSGLSSPFLLTEWYRERPFQVAFAVSVLLHALLIAFVPGLRSVKIEPPQVMRVEIAIPEEKPSLQNRKTVAPPRQSPEPRPEVAPPPLAQPEPPPPPKQAAPREAPVEPVPMPALREPQPSQPPATAELAPPPVEAPRLEPMAEPKLVLPAQPAAPAPKIEPRPEPLGRAEPPMPRTEPQPAPPAEVKPQHVPEPVPPVMHPPESSPAPVAKIAPPPPTAVTAAPPASTVAPDAVDDALTQHYSGLLSAQIRRYQRYPLIAQRRGWEGTAEVLLKIAPDGRVVDITLGRSSGRDVLDQEALNMVRRAAPLPQAPEGLRGHRLNVTVPIVFRLQNS